LLELKQYQGMFEDIYQRSLLDGATGRGAAGSSSAQRVTYYQVFAATAAAAAAG
jgi:hypothetical protein